MESNYKSIQHKIYNQDKNKEKNVFIGRIQQRSRTTEGKNTYSTKMKLRLYYCSKCKRKHHIETLFPCSSLEMIKFLKLPLQTQSRKV